MTDYEVGYGRPPRHTRFKLGTSGNKAGRPPKPKSDRISDVIRSTLDAPIKYREHGRTKMASRSEVGWTRIINNAVQGDLRAIVTVTKLLIDSSRSGAANFETIEIFNWPEDYPGQTAEQKTREYLAGRSIPSRASSDEPITPLRDAR